MDVPPSPQQMFPMGGTRKLGVKLEVGAGPYLGFLGILHEK